MTRTSQPDKSIKDTGERMVPAYHKGHMVYGEHIVRYQAATDLVKGKVVLDIAAGSGYGTAELAQTAKMVYGVDLDEDAVAYANKNYASKNITFIEGSGTSIPLEENSVDVVVSFETIEHIEAYEDFMREVVRVLKPDGLFILSTPNDIEFPENNHYHVHEFEENELLKLVKKSFSNVKQYYQATWLYNALLDENGLGTEWENDIRTLQTAPIDRKKSIYFYMLCSNRKLTESVKPLAAVSEHYSARSLQDYENSVRNHIEEQGKIIKHLENKVHDAEAIELQLKQLKAKLEKIESTLVWRARAKAKRIIKGQVTYTVHK